MQKLRGYKYQLEPSSEVAAKLAQQAGACRFVYNLALEQRQKFYRPGRKFNYVQQAREVAQIRAEVDWLAAVHGHALQQALKDLDTAFVNFFSGRASYPRPRVKGINDSFRVPQDKNAIQVRKLNANHSAVKLPKLGWIKFRSHRPLVGKICNATVSLNGGKWWISIQTEVEIEVIPSTLPSVGIDRGVKVLLALSTGEMIEPANALAKHADRLKKSQQVLARRKRGSKRYAKQKVRINRIHTKIARTRNDQIHKASLSIAERFGTVVIEALKTRNMTASAAGTVAEPGNNVTQKSGLNRSILDKGWHKFETLLAYKLAERGGTLVKVNPAFTSQTCSCCGTISKHSRESQARFECVSCGHTANADVNAAININRAGTRLLSAPSEAEVSPAMRTKKRRKAYA
jgi:putative transposase